MLKVLMCQLWWTEGSIKLSSSGRRACLVHIWASALGWQRTDLVRSIQWGAIQSPSRVASLVPAPVETEEVIPLEECCFSLRKTKAGIIKADGKGTGRRGSHGRRTWDNRINHMKNVTDAQMELSLGDEAGLEKLREPCITWVLFIQGINSYCHMVH